MPKQRRAAASRSATRPAPRKSSSRGSESSASSRSSSRALSLAGRTRTSKPTPRSKSSAVSGTAKPVGKDRTVVPKIPMPTAPAALPPPRRPAFYEALTVYESGRSRATASRLHISRRQLSGGHPTVSGRERARGTRPALPAGLRARNGASAIRPRDAVGVCLRRHRCPERRRCGGGSWSPHQGTGKGAGQRPRSLYYGCCPSRQGQSVSRTRSPPSGHRP